MTASRMLEPEVAELADVSSEEDVDRLFTTVNPGAMEQLPPTDNDAALAALHQLVEEPLRGITQVALLCGNPQ